MENEIPHIRAVIYARVSTKEQADGKPSVPDQIAQCKKAIIDHGWELATEPFTDDVSGHLTEERVGLQDMLAEARLGKFDLVIVKDFDRFARNRTYAGQIRDQLKKMFIQTYSLSTSVEPKAPKDYDPLDDDLGLMVEGVSDTMAEIERNKIRRRMSMGKVAVAKSGKIPNNVPYGYKILRSLDEKGKVHRKVEINEEQAKVVQRIYNDFSRGKGKRAIAFDLIQDNISSPKGGRWTAHTVQYILTNRTYTGKVMWGWRHADYKVSKQRQIRGHDGIMVDGEHTPIIDEPLFESVQNEKKIRGNSYKGRAEQSHGLLTGIAKCIRCGSGVTSVRRFIKNSKRNPGWKDVETYTYLCAGHKYSNICQSRVMSATKLEGTILDQIKSLLNNSSVRDKLIYNKQVKLTDTFTDELSQAERKLSELPVKMKKQPEAYEAGLITLEEYGVAMSRLREDQNKYHAVTVGSQTKVLELNKRKLELDKFLESLTDFDNLWAESNLAEKKHFLRTIIKEIRAGNGKVEIDYRF